MTERAYKRTRMFIDAREQIFLAIRSTVHIVIFALAFGILLYGPGESGMRLSDTQRITNEFLYAQSGRLWLVFPALAVVWLVTVIGSHRIVGPVHSFQNTLHHVLQGDLTQQLTHRKGDHFAALAGTINETLSAQRALLTRLRSELHQAQESLGKEGATPPEKLSAARHALSSAAAMIDGYRL
ncbi:MAG: hypothetical protein AB1405_01745 [Bdellovibrionota bacterium]